MFGWVLNASGANEMIRSKEGSVSIIFVAALTRKFYCSFGMKKILFYSF